MSSKHDSSTPISEGSNHITVGIITISDRASAGDYDDLGGPAVKKARRAEPVSAHGMLRRKQFAP